MKKQKKISLLDADCIELLSYEDRIFVALFKKDFTLCMWSDRRDAYDIWALMDCSGNTSLLRQYLLGKTSLHALFNKCKVTKAYEYHDAWFELVPQKDDVSAELVEPYPDVYLRCKGIDVDALVPRNCEYMPWHYVKKSYAISPYVKMFSPDANSFLWWKSETAFSNYTIEKNFSSYTKECRYNAALDLQNEISNILSRKPRDATPSGYVRPQAGACTEPLAYGEMQAYA